MPRHLTLCSSPLIISVALLWTLSSSSTSLVLRSRDLDTALQDSLVLFCWVTFGQSDPILPRCKTSYAHSLNFMRFLSATSPDCQGLSGYQHSSLVNKPLLLPLCHLQICWEYTLPYHLDHEWHFHHRSLLQILNSYVRVKINHFFPGKQSPYYSDIHILSQNWVVNSTQEKFP